MPRSPAPSASRTRSPRRGLRAALALTAFALAVASSAVAADFYVAPAGSDANAGTLAAPFASLARAQTAASSGDTVWVRGGTYASFAIAATDANYNYVHRLNKSGLTWSAYPGEKPVFNFSGVPTNLRVCGFHVTGNGLVIRGFEVTGVKDGAQKQSECFRIDGSAAYVDFYDCTAHDNAANGFYFTNRSRGSCTRCDAYNNIGTNGESIGNTDGFGAHGNGVVFRYCRAWNNSDDGYDCISSDGSNTFDHCWAYNMKAGGDSNGFKVGGYGSGSVPATVPVHTVLYCLAANNNSHGFYANHQPGQAAVWTHNTAYNHSAGNFDMLERVSPADATDIPGYREVLHQNVSFAGTIIKDDANPAANVTDNSWTNGATVNAADFLSLDASQMILPRSAGNNMPFISFMHLAPDSDLAGLGCFVPPPPAPTGLTAGWVSSGRVDLAWTASPGATAYYVKRATVSGGPYTTVATRLTGTTYSDTAVSGGTTFYYAVSAMDDVSYDESVSAEVAATLPAVAITGIDLDSGRSATDGITNDATLILNGVAGANQPVVVSETGVGVLGNTSADATGHWSYNHTATSLGEGAHTFAVLESGSNFLSDPFAVTVDTLAPAAPAIASVGAAPLAIGGTAEPLSEVAVTLDGATAAGTTFAAANGAWSVVCAVPLSAGAHTFTATASDTAGNTGGASPSFAIDTSLTTPAILAAQSDAGPLASGTLTTDSTLAFSGTAGAGDTVTFTKVGAGALGTTTADGSGNWTFDYTGTALADGTHQFTATGSNGGGTSPGSAVFTVTVDSTAPLVASINRQTPATATVTSSVASVVFRVTFNETVTGVTAGSFALTTTGGATGNIASVSASSGAVFDVTVDTLAGTGTLRLDLKSSGSGVTDPAGNAAPAFAAGQTYTRVISSTGNGTWIQPESGGLWSDADNWLDAIIPSASTHSANFATLDLTTLNTVHLDSPRTVNTVTFGDTATATSAGWFLDDNGTVTNALTLAGTVPTITVNALGTGATATIGARLAGTGGFTKAGPGTLVLTGANTLSGALSTSAGVLRVGAGNLGASTISVNSAAQLDVNGGTLTASGTTTITGATNTSLVVNGGTATFATVTFTSASGGLFRINDGTVGVSTVTIPRSSDATISYATGFVVTGGTSTVGAINLGTGNSNGVMSVEGGALTVTGPLVVGNQTSAGRGGAFRITGGTFNSTDAAFGLALARTNGANANNVAEANFLGGVSTLEKITLGYSSAVTAGSGTVTVNGGSLYLGAGSIVKNGTAGMTTTINLTSGLLGAKANWSAAHPFVLNGGAFTVKAANAADTPFDIALTGAISGAGSLVKTGAGKLTLGATETFAGNATVQAGTLDLTGSLAAGGTLAVNTGGTLGGAGTSNKPITLASGGVIAPAGAAAGTLTGAALTWNGGGDLAFNLGATSDRLQLAGALTKGAAGTYRFVFTGAPANGTAFTVISAASTTFTAADFSATGVAGYFGVTGGDVTFTVGPQPGAAFLAWAASLPAGQRGPNDDPDGDGVANLLEFLFGSDGAAAGVSSLQPTTVNDAGTDYPAVSFTQRSDHGDVATALLVAADLDFATDLGAVSVSATPLGGGLELVVIRSAQPLAAQPRQFFKLRATLPGN